MKQCFTKRCGLALVLMLFAFVQGVWAEETTKQTYDAYFGTKGSSTTYEATAGQSRFTRPVLTVTSGDKSIRSKFSYRWYIKGKTDADVTEVKGKKSTIDDRTGSSVQYLYGVVKIGDKAGTFTVQVKLTPIDKSKYDEKTVEFTVNVKSPEVTIAATSGSQTLTDGSSTLTLNTYKNQWGDWNSVSMALPKLTVSSKVEDITSDVTTDFDISYSFADGNKFTANASAGTFTSTAGESEADGVLTITAKPKSDKTATYGDITKTFTVNVKSVPLTNGQKIATTFKFPNRVEEHYRNYRVKKDGVWTWKNDAIPIQKPVITDSYGNDVTFAYDFTLGYYDGDTFVENYQVPGQDVYYKYSGDPLDDYPKDANQGTGWHYTKYPNTSKLTKYGSFDYGFDWNSTRVLDDYLVAVKATVKSQYSNIYGEPSNMTTKLSEPVEGMLYGNEKDGYKNQNVYTLHNNEYVYRNYKHAPKLVFTPDPEKLDVQMANGLELTPATRFILEGAFPYELEFGKPVDTDSLLYNGVNGYETFWYSFFVPDEINYDKLTDEKKAEVSAAGYKGSTYIQIIKGFQPNPFDDKQMIYELTDQGKVKTDETTGKPITKVVDGIRYFSERNWGNQGSANDVLVKFYGNGYLPMYYTIVPWNNYWDIGSAQLAVIHVVESEPTHLVIDPKTIYTNTNSMSAAPSVKVVDQFGVDVSEHFDITPAKAEESNYNYTLVTEGEDKYRVTPSQAGNYVVNVTAKKKSGDTSKYTDPEGDNYTVIATGKTGGNTGGYEIIYDENEFKANGLDDEYNSTTKTYERSNTKMGKLHFIKEGDFQPATISYEEVPGINITFGTKTEVDEGDMYNVVTKTSDKSTSDLDNENDVANATDNTKVDRKYLEIGTFVANNEGKPTQGFIQIDVLTNGYLKIDAIFDKTGIGQDDIQQYILHDLTTNSSDNQVIALSSAYTGEKQFPLPLIAGHSYALYTDGTMYLHGLDFDPAFIALETDHEGWHSAVTFPNGYTGSLPRLRPASKVNTVTYYAKDTKSNSVSSAIENVTGTEGFHLSIDANTGAVSAKELTGDGTLKMNASSKSEMDDRVTIVASVKGEKKTVGGKEVYVEKRPHYNLFIGNMPTYIVPEGANYDPGQKYFSTTNIPTRIWMTIGGWENTNQQEYPYFKNNDPERLAKNALSDGWKTAKMDSVGRDNMIVDNFSYQATGLQNPVDEIVESWNNTKTMMSRGGTTINVKNDKGSHTFNVPVRGTYLKFEPEESGRLFVYVLQNGMTDIATTDGKKRNANSEDYYLRRRAMYIVDESGNNVTLTDGKAEWGGMDKYLSESDDNFPGYDAPNKNYYTNGMLRCNWDFGAGLKFDEREGEEPKYSWRSAYENTGKDANGRYVLTTKGQNDYDADKATVEKWWKGQSYNGKSSKLNGPLEVIKLSDGGYVIPTKGYVRYTFEVKAGKTYFMFTTGSKIGFCGFGFLPEGYTRGDNATKWINAANGKSLNEDATAFESSTYDALPDVNTSDLYVTTADKEGYVYGGSDDIVLRAKKQSTESDSYETQKSNITKRSFVNVKLDRTIRNQRWNGICLPFSVSEKQVKEIFGENSSVITFDSVRADKHGVNPETGEEEDQSRTVHFTRHVSQLIEAGRPYFIYPDVTGKNAGDPLGTKDGDGYYIQFKRVTFEGKEPMTDIAYNDSVADYNNKQTDDSKKIDIFTYKASGIYDCSRVPFYSYYMKATDQGTGNGLSRLVPSSPTTDLTKTPLLVGYNTYLYPYSNDAEGKDLVKTEDTESPAKMASFWITGGDVNGGEVTAIDELVQYLNVEQTSFIGGVYTLDGYKVRSDNSLKGLKPGTYIMGGKKYTVK